MFYFIFGEKFGNKDKKNYIDKSNPTLKKIAL